RRTVIEESHPNEPFQRRLVLRVVPLGMPARPGFGEAPPSLDPGSRFRGVGDAMADPLPRRQKLERTAEDDVHDQAELYGPSRDVDAPRTSPGAPHRMRIELA